MTPGRVVKRHPSGGRYDKEPQYWIILSHEECAITTEGKLKPENPMKVASLMVIEGDNKIKYGWMPRRWNIDQSDMYEMIL